MPSRSNKNEKQKKTAPLKGERRQSASQLAILVRVSYWAHMKASPTQPLHESITNPSVNGIVLKEENFRGISMANKQSEERRRIVIAQE